MQTHRTFDGYKTGGQLNDSPVCKQTGIGKPQFYKGGGGVAEMSVSLSKETLSAENEWVARKKP